MNGVLGGFKNMLRRWRINLKNKKKKNKRNPKKTSFIYSTLAIIYSFFGHMFFKNENKVSIEQPKLYKKVEQINFKLDEVIVGKQENIKTITKEIEKLKQELDVPMSIESKKYFQEKVKEIELKTKFIENPNKVTQAETKIISQSLEKNIKKINKPKQLNEQLLKKLPISIAVTRELAQQNQPKKGIDNKSFIKAANKEISFVNDKIKEIETKIPNIKEYNHFYDLENDLKYLRKKLETLKEKYKEIKDQLNIDIDFDKYELCKSPKKIEETLDKIENDLKLIETKKQELLSKKETKKEETKKEKQKEQKKEVKQKKQEVDDVIKAQQLILNNIVNQNKYFDDYMKKMAKSTNKKRTILSSLSNFANVILNFTVSLLPVSLFKNRLLGPLVSSIMINNSIKTMRRMLNPNLKINYQLFIDNYNNSKSILYETYDMCINSLEELSDLKNELSLYKQDEIKQILLQIELIENNIKNQIKSLNIKKENLEKVYVKVRKEID